jgi:hypothetical protein
MQRKQSKQADAKEVLIVFTFFLFFYTVIYSLIENFMPHSIICRSLYALTTKFNPTTTTTPPIPTIFPSPQAP